MQFHQIVYLPPGGILDLYAVFQPLTADTGFPFAGYKYLVHSILKRCVFYSFDGIGPTWVLMLSSGIKFWGSKIKRKEPSHISGFTPR